MRKPRQLALDVCEADGKLALARGMQGFKVRLARRLNALLGRTGTIFAERYHARPLATPREVRNALSDVLLNGRHHAAERGEVLACDWIDPCSSGPWFTGWAQPSRCLEPWLKELRQLASPTAPATVWLLTTGWRRRGGLAFT